MFLSVRVYQTTRMTRLGDAAQELVDLVVGERLRALNGKPLFLLPFHTRYW